MRKLAPQAGEDLSSPFADLSPALYYTLQPIVDACTGAVYGYEALLRGTDTIGSPSIDVFFDRVHAAGDLGRTELALMQLAMTTYRRLPHKSEKKLFLNVDGRALGDPDFALSEIGAIADRVGVSRASLCLELSEKHNISAADTIRPLIGKLRNQGLRLAVDDFGQGYSELKLLYEASPEYVKIDRFFINEIDRSSRKRLFVNTVVDLAHTLGAQVVAEGVETREEYIACRQAGCDLVQGWYLARPIRDVATAPAVYPHAAYCLDPAATLAASEAAGIEGAVERIEAVPVTTPLERLFLHFHIRPDRVYVPVVDGAGEPLGLVYERDLRAFSYSRFGRDVLATGAVDKRLRDFVCRTPSIEIDSDIERIVEAVVLNADAQAVILTRNLRYVGVITPPTLLRILHERGFIAAEDRNRISMLPGRTSLIGYLMAADVGKDRLVAVFDFNHFKAFNDAYGFRRGDRAIALFAALLREFFQPLGAFLCHCGGDDFCAVATGVDRGAFEAAVRATTVAFRRQIESFYEPEDRDRGFLTAPDRGGEIGLHPIMTCSAAILVYEAGHPLGSFETAFTVGREAKQASKLSQDGIVTRIVG